MIERINRFLKSLLTRTLDEASLPLIQYVINNIYHPAIKSTPSKLLLGLEQREHADDRLRDFVNTWSGLEKDYLAERTVV